ncbi:MAG: X2-like carbohydrate binding domain-containing protein, partial [Hominisplanchenecus sp.]
MRKKWYSSIISLMLALVLCVSGILPSMQVSAAEAAADTASWKIQDWGGTTDIDIQDGWIESSENGFVLNYDKIISDRAKEGLVLYDSKAEQYEDSTLEMDIKVEAAGDSGQVGFYSVAFLSRFLNGAHCEGIAIHDKGRLQRATYNGSESWAWVRDDKGDFLFGETYHIKVVTEGDQLTFSAAKKGEELQQLVSFTMQGGLGKSGYGFRIWRGAKKITVENIVRTELNAETEEGSSLNETETTVPDAEWGQATINIPVTFAEGDSVKSINDGEIDLTEGSHYNVDTDNSIITISPDYMKGQTTKDEITLTISFASGAEGSFKIIREASANGGWVFQKQNSTETVEAKDGWIKVSENGTKVVIDYGQVVKDAGE